MVKKNTDLLNDPLAVAQTRYREQIDSFKNQYLPKPKDPFKETLKSRGITLDQWMDLFN